MCSLTQHFTILSAKLYAIKIAIMFIHDFRNCKLIIFTDSLSAPNSIPNYYNKKQSTRNFSRSHSVLNTFTQNIQGNEIADHYAKFALQIPPTQNTPIPLSDLNTYTVAYVRDTPY